MHNLIRWNKLADLVNSIGGATGIMNYIVSLFSGFINWIQTMPTFLKMCAILIACGIAYVVFEFKYGVKQIPRTIQI